MLSIIILERQGKLFKGIVDTGANVSIIFFTYCPCSWALQEISYGLKGVGTLLLPLSDRVLDVYKAMALKGI